ncbi:MAG TPA: hypothetical protein VK158_04360, partial [Acidobacteriota bacterium]|nr:hypothetical protein [Acidobacteriota bacterium]
IHTQKQTVTFDEKDVFEDHEAVLHAIMHTLIEYDLQHIDCVAHHIFHGGSYTQPMQVTDGLIHTLHDLSPFAPNENPSSILTIMAAQKTFSKAIQIAVFDTSFHQTMPQANSMYAIPKEYRDEGVRKYGFNGITHSCVAKMARKSLLEKDHERYYANNKIVSCVLDTSVSICAIEDGKSINVSQGFSPLTGPMMSTKTGDIDPAALAYICRKHKKNIDTVLIQLQKKGGFYSFIQSGDIEEAYKLANEGSVDAQIAIDKFVNDCTRSIAGAIADLKGVDAVAFCGAYIHATWLLAKICKKLECFNISTQPKIPMLTGDMLDITGPESAVNVFLFKPKEAIEIAREARKIAEQK